MGISWTSAQMIWGSAISIEKHAKVERKRIFMRTYDILVATINGA